MFFLTYNDLPSGIYSSQVMDVCTYISKQFGIRVKLIAFISLRNFIDNRKKIKLQYANSIVLPMFPKQRNWRLNIISLFLVFLFHKKKTIIARGPFASNLALSLRKMGGVKKVCFDGRGASFAELTEYKVVEDDGVKNEIFQIEKKAVLNADFRIAVSEKLVDYWKEQFDCNDNNYVVIPCTLNSQEKFNIPTERKS